MMVPDRRSTQRGCSARPAGVASFRIAKWDGEAWSALAGPNGVGLNAQAYALAVFDDGNGPALYAGGSFSLAGGIEAGRIAKWDGARWSPVAGPQGWEGVTGVSSPEVVALAVFDDGTGPALYVGGDFTIVAGVQATGIARWDGSVWSSVGGETGPVLAGQVSKVRALTVWNDGTGVALYVGGHFESVDGALANRIAKWDGVSWSVLAGTEGIGVSGVVNALAGFDDDRGPALYAGGHFSRSDAGPLGTGTLSSFIARWGRRCDE